MTRATTWERHLVKAPDVREGDRILIAGAHTFVAMGTPRRRDSNSVAILAKSRGATTTLYRSIDATMTVMRATS